MLRLPQLVGALKIASASVNGIGGWRAVLRLPHEHSHRPFSVIKRLIARSRMPEDAKALSTAAFKILADAEGAVHGVPSSQVVFHEVGALDSILDMCLASLLYCELHASRCVVSPLPIADGTVETAHGLVSSPAPAVMEMLRGIPVYGAPTRGETVTPTALALLRAFKAEFGPWPAIEVRRTARAFGSRILPGVPNGALFALGTPSSFGPGLGARPGAGRRDHVHHHGATHTR